MPLGSHATDSNADRLARRRARRWRRRAELFAPFLAVPVILGLLTLSVNLIEHRPDSSASTPPDATNPQADADPFGSGVDADSMSPESIIATAIAADMPLASDFERRAAEGALIDSPVPTSDLIREAH